MEETEESKSACSGSCRITSPKMLIGGILVAVLGVGGYFVLKARHQGTISMGTFTPQAEAAEVVSLKVDGMTCGGCAPGVTKALMDVPGVQAAEVDWKSGAAKVQVNKGTPKTKLIEAVKAAGFSAA